MIIIIIMYLLSYDTTYHGEKQVLYCISVEKKKSLSSFVNRE